MSKPFTIAGKEVKPAWLAVGAVSMAVLVTALLPRTRAFFVRLLPFASIYRLISFLIGAYSGTEDVFSAVSSGVAAFSTWAQDMAAVNTPTVAEDDGAAKSALALFNQLYDFSNEDKATNEAFKLYQDKGGKLPLSRFKSQITRPRVVDLKLRRETDAKQAAIDAFKAVYSGPEQAQAAIDDSFKVYQAHGGSKGKPAFVTEIAKPTQNEIDKKRATMPPLGGIIGLDNPQASTTFADLIPEKQGMAFVAKLSRMVAQGKASKEEIDALLKEGRSMQLTLELAKEAMQT